MNSYSGISLGKERLAFKAEPVGWFSKLLWRFIRVRVRQV